VRVITGSAKGRKLTAVPGPGTRPITARVKSALFSILGPAVYECMLLDLFGGTGAVGIEALSRGAQRVVFVERARKAIFTIRKNLEITRLAERAEIIQADAFQYLNSAPADLAFDFIYVAPPQHKALWAKALLALDAKPLLSPDGQIIVQIHPKEYEPLTIRNLRLTDERRYGSTVLLFYALKEGGRAEAQGASEE
jgi:16S rRNA (guanine966-N2)-methyltransferase